MESKETQQQEQTNSMFDGIEEALDVDTSIVKNENGCVKRSDEAKPIKDQLKQDYEYSRGQLYNLIEKGQENGASDTTKKPSK